MGISRDSRHKRRETGGKRKMYRKKRKFELGRQPANTKLGAKRVRSVRVRGGNLKFRALRLETGNFSWGSEVCARKTRIIDVVYNASNNELVRTKTLVKNCVVSIDATPFRQWYESHYGIKMNQKQDTTKKDDKKTDVTTDKEFEKESDKKNFKAVKSNDRKKDNKGDKKAANKSDKKSEKKTDESNAESKKSKFEKRNKNRILDAKIEEQIIAGRILACISSRPGQSGRADGYILEGKELEFYQKKISSKKHKK